MTILEIMERAGTKDVKLVRAWIKDGIQLIQSTGVDGLKIKKQTLLILIQITQLLRLKLEKIN